MTTCAVSLSPSLPPSLLPICHIPYSLLTLTSHTHTSHTHFSHSHSHLILTSHTHISHSHSHSSLILTSHTHSHSSQAVKELGQWNGQCPPTAKHQKGKVITPKIKDVIGNVRNTDSGWRGGREGGREGGVSSLATMSLILLSSQSLPEFGPYMEEKEKKVAAYKASIVPLEEFPAAVHRPALQPSRPIASVQVCRGVLMIPTTVILCIELSINKASQGNTNPLWSVISKSNEPSQMRLMTLVRCLDSNFSFVF